MSYPDCGESCNINVALIPLTLNLLNIRAFRYLRLAAFIFLSTATIAQKQFPPSPNALDENGLRSGHWTLLYDSVWKEVSTPDSAVYYRLLRFEKGKPVGKVRDFFRTGNKQWEGYLSSLNPDVFEGEAISYYENGVVESKRNYVGGVLNGPAYNYTINGVISAEGAFKDGLKEGFWKLYFENGSIQSEVEMHADEIHGISKRYSPNGQLNLLSTKTNGNAQGLWEEYYENGQVKLRSHYINGNDEGPYETFYQNGKRKEKGQHSNDLKIGRWFTYDSLGQVLSEGNYDRNGKATGIWKTYYSNGVLSGMGTKADDYQNGLWTFYHDNGKVHSTGVLKRSLWEGEWKFYYDNGHLKQHSFYVRDTIHGMTKEYFESGPLRREGKCVMGLYDGAWHEYNEKGTLVLDAFYQNGKEDGVWKSFDNDGNLTSHIPYRAGFVEGLVERYHANGVVSDRVHYVRGLREGTYESFFENGAKNIVAKFKSDTLEGEFLSYFPDGTLSKQYFYHRDEYEGPFNRYHENGKILLEGEALHSKQHGRSRRYFMNGNLQEEGEYRDDVPEGRWLFYDSATGQKTQQCTFVKGSANGPWQFFDAKGQVTRTDYYIHGFQENQKNVQDSIEHLINAQRYPEALRAVDWLVQVTERDFQNKVNQTLPLSMRGKVYAAMTDYKNALKWHLAYLKEVKKYQGAASANYKVAVHNVAAAYHGLGDYKKALQLYDEAIALAAQDGLGQSYWSSVINKVYCLYDADREEDAAALLDAELANAEKILGEHEPTGWYLRLEAGKYYYDRPDDYDKAYGYFDPLLKDVESVNPDHEYALACARRLGDIIYDRGDWQEAIPFYEKAVAYSERHGLTMVPSYAEMVVNLFYAYDEKKGTDSSHYQNYEIQYRKLSTQANVVTSPNVLAKVKLAMSNFLYGKARYADALPLLREAEVNLLAAGKGNTIRHSAILQTLAFTTLYANRANYPEGEKYFLKSIDIRKQLAERTSSVYYKSVIELAGYYNETGNYHKAIDILKNIGTALDSAKDYAANAKRLKYIAENFDGLFDYRQSISYYQQALTFYEPNARQYPVFYLNCVNGLSNAHKYLEDYENAKRYANVALTFSEEYWGKENRMYLDNLGRLADVHARFKVLSEAISQYQLQLAGLEKLLGKESTKYMLAINSLAEANLSMGNAAACIQLVESVRDKTIEINGRNSAEHLLLVNLLARSYENLGKQDLAESFFRSGYEIAIEVFGAESQFSVMYGYYLGQFYDNRNRLNDAEEVLQQVVGITVGTDMGSTSLASAYLAALASVKQQLDKNKEAEEYYTMAYRIARQDTIQSPAQYINSGQNLGRFYGKMGRLREAEKLLRQTMAFVEKREGRKTSYISVGIDLALVYYRQSKYDSMRAHVGRLLIDLEETNSKWGDQSVTLHNYLGIAADDQNDFETARKEYTFCLQAYSARGTLSEGEMSSFATFHSNVARIDLATGYLDDARRHLEEADRLRKLARTPAEMKTWAPTQWNWAHYYKLANRPAEAEARWNTLNQSLLRYIDDNFYFMSDEEKAQFWGEVKSYFTSYQSFAMQRSKENPFILGDAYNIRLSTKALLLSSSNKIKKRVLSSGDASLTSLYYQWQQVREKMAQLHDMTGVVSASQKKRIDSLRLKANEMEREMNVTAEDMMADKGGERTDWKVIQQSLRGDEAAVEIIRFKHVGRISTDSVVYAALILTMETKDHPAVVFMPNGALLEGKSFKWYKNAMAAQLRDTLSYHQFWTPLSAVLQNKRNIYISLDGVYNQINLNTLLTPTGKYLVDDKKLVLVSNTKDVLSIKTRKAKRFSRSVATIFGFPSYFLGREKLREEAGVKREIDWSTVADSDQTGIAPLFGTQAEIEKVTKVLGDAKMETAIFINEQASEVQIKQVLHPRVLHIATHGFFIDRNDSPFGMASGSADDQSNPLFKSGLLLAGVSNYLQNRITLGEENGILTAFEAANLNLENTDLVVLSACETGKGEVQNGEGVYGLQRAFQTAGAQSIIMSLWKVDDAATQELMSSFYQYWISGNSMDSALQQAQLELKKKYPHPYYWGAFVMMEN